MNYNRRAGAGIPLVAVLLLATLVGACAPAPEKSAYKRQFFTLGTVVEISLWDVDEPLAAEAVRRVEAVLNDIHVRWHAWEPSELTRLNAAIAAGEASLVSPETADVLRLAREYAHRSGDLFNPAIGRLVDLWGFHSGEPPTGPPPSTDAIQALLDAAPSMADLRFDDEIVHSDNAAVQLDLGAFAKGYAVDRAIVALHELGIQDAIVNAGGDLRAIGRHGDRPWRIGIRQPDNQGGILASIETRRDESVFTSGNYERYFDFEGQRYHHILDPRDGYPAQHTLSVTVIHHSAAIADAAATALFVAGPADWVEMARSLGISHMMLIDADKTIHMTPKMMERIRFEADPPPKVIVVDVQV